MHVLDRFFEKISIQRNGCWTWTAYLDCDGYGTFRDEHSQKVRAHRFAYRYFRSPILDGMVIDHICRNRSCVNPLHLRIVTASENVLQNSESHQAINKRKTHCKYGHKFDDENTGIDKRGDRYCKQCACDRSRRRYAEKHK